MDVPMDANGVLVPIGAAPEGFAFWQERGGVTAFFCRLAPNHPWLVTIAFGWLDFPRRGAK